MFRFKAHVSLTYIVKVFMSIQPAIVLTIISCSTPSSHQVSLRSFFFFLSRKPSKSNLTVIYKVKDHILILKKLSGLMFVMPKMIFFKKGNRNYASLCHE